ncbi:hypothetical protein ACQPXH_00205 [Nocardia sp. CA-135953]|uniref:hypothetical protein n=1 Tax=Nocardia sp. CA-135953 TaxID=3239978 RepID=UPI003D99BC58
MSDMDTALKEMMAVDGALGAAIVDYESGMALGTAGGSKALDLEIAAAGNTEIVRAKQRTLAQLGLQQDIEDILISLSGQYHIIRPLSSRQSHGLFLYLALDRNRANLALARHRLKNIDDQLQI